MAKSVGKAAGAFASKGVGEVMQTAIAKGLTPVVRRESELLSLFVAEFVPEVGEVDGVWVLPPMSIEREFLAADSVAVLIGCWFGRGGLYVFSCEGGGRGYCLDWRGQW